MSETVQGPSQTLGFQTEVKQLLHLMIHSLYSNKEIFLRELISNASDANDKLRLKEPGSNLSIRVAIDKENRTVSVTDTGIGMTQEQAITHLGTIAKSGTKEFLGTLTGDQAKDQQLIGQFGVGFYSAFIVGDKVTVLTRAHGTPAEAGVKWTSTGEGEFTIESVRLDNIGTTVKVHLKPGEDEFLERFRISGIIRKYSDHISFPILMEKELTEEDKKENKEAGDETLNKATALWARNKSDIKEEEYNEFYKHISHDFNNPLEKSHFTVEGKQEYTGLIYLPEQAPFDLFTRENKRGLKLFIKRVFIMDDAEQFLPNYLRFVKGVIDSNDLPLNISREILQNSKLVDAIRSGVTKKVLDLIEKIAKNDKEKYTKFWQHFGEVLKEGPIEDFANKERIAKLCRFATTYDDHQTQNVTLADYIARMPEGQKKIYYLTGESLAAVKASPHLEVFRKKGIEVLLLHHRVDEWFVTHLNEFEGKTLQSIAKGSLDLDDVDGDSKEGEDKKPDQKALDETHKDFITRVKEALGDKVKEVHISQRLTSSPSCVVSDDNDMNQQLQRMLQAAGQEVPVTKPILELNPEHVLVKNLENEPDETRFADWCNILLDQAILAEGGRLTSPAEFVSRLNQFWLEYGLNNK